MHKPSQRAEQTGWNLDTKWRHRVSPPSKVMLTRGLWPMRAQMAPPPGHKQMTQDVVGWQFCVVISLQWEGYMARPSESFPSFSKEASAPLTRNDSNGRKQIWPGREKQILNLLCQWYYRFFLPWINSRNFNYWKLPGCLSVDFRSKSVKFWIVLNVAPGESWMTNSEDISMP